MWRHIKGRDKGKYKEDMKTTDSWKCSPSIFWIFCRKERHTTKSMKSKNTEMSPVMKSEK